MRNQQIRYNNLIFSDKDKKIFDSVFQKFYMNVTHIRSEGTIVDIDRSWNLLQFKVHY